MFEKLVRETFKDRPEKTLFHYTSYAGLLGIVDSRSLHLTEVRHLNDAQEIKEFKLSLHYEINRRVESYVGQSQKPDVLDFSSPAAKEFYCVRAFESWLVMKFGNERWSLFVGSFSEEGNLLSQWRGYCPYGKGVSLGFTPSAVQESARFANVLLGKCIYDHADKMTLAKKVMDQVVAFARSKKDVMFDSLKDNSVFDILEPSLITIAALIKHRDFREEKEWRVVVPTKDLSQVAGLQFKEGAYSLVPFVEMKLPISNDAEPKLILEEIMLGPTADEDLAFRSLKNFMRLKTRCTHVYRTRSPYKQKVT